MPSAPPNPYRVLAFALDAGDAPLAALLLQRLFPRHPRAARVAVERLARLLDL